MGLVDYLFPTELVRPDPSDTAPGDLEVGDTVRIQFEDWYEGAHELQGVVINLLKQDRVKIKVCAGSETRRYSVERGLCTLIRRES